MREKLDILLEAVTILGFEEYIAPIRKPGRPRSLERL